MTSAATSTGRVRRRPGAAPESMKARTLELHLNWPVIRWLKSAQSPSVPTGALHRSLDPQPRTRMSLPPGETGWEPLGEDARRLGHLHKHTLVPTCTCPASPTPDFGFL